MPNHQLFLPTDLLISGTNVVDGPHGGTASICLVQTWPVVVLAVFSWGLFGRAKLMAEIH